MPFDLGPGTAAALAVALLGAAYVRGYSGFGFSAIFIAFAALLTNPLPLIPVVFTCEIIMTALQARGIRGHIDWPRVGWLLFGAAIALPVSVTVILSVGPDIARLLVSAIVSRSMIDGALMAMIEEALPGSRFIERQLILSDAFAIARGGIASTTDALREEVAAAAASWGAIRLFAVLGLTAAAVAGMRLL